MQSKKHFSVLVHDQAKKYGPKPVITFRNFGSSKWKTVSWNQFSLRVKQVSNAFLNFGVNPQEHIAVFSQNCIQYLYTDFGAYGVRAVSIPLYATSSEQHIQYVINDAEIKYIFVGEQEQYDKVISIFSLCATLERIIIFDPNVKINPYDTNSIFFEEFLELGSGLPRQSEVEALWKSSEYTDICNILYTSGTTGESKGVILTDGMYNECILANKKCVPVSSKDRVINFLPFAHVFERAWSYLILSCGGELIVNTYPKEIQESLKQIHPTCMASVPRFWEKVFVAINDKIDSGSFIQRKLFKKALSIGRKRNIHYKCRCKYVPPLLELKYFIVNKLIFSKIRKELGLEKPNIFPTAGAYVSPKVEEFIHSIGIFMMVGYGLTESGATVSCDTKTKPLTIGSVGRIIDGLKVKIGKDNEILLKGPTITPGYFRKDHINKVAFDEEGFFHTGDAGYIKDGELFLTERIKDLFKTSNGKYIAPQMIESMLLVDKFIEQVTIIADQRKYVTALVVPKFKILENWANENGIKYTDYKSLCENEKVQKMMKGRIDTIQQLLSSYEQIKCFTLIPHEFTMENGELTNTLKIRRGVINNKYKEIIDKMYK